MNKAAKGRPYSVTDVDLASRFVFPGV